MVDYKNHKPLIPASASKWITLGAWVASAGLVLWSIVSLIDNIGAFCALALAIYVFGMSMQAILAGAAEDGLTVKECFLMAVWPKEAFRLVRAGSMKKDELRKLFESQHINSVDDTSTTLIGEKVARWAIIGLLVTSIIGIVVGVFSLLPFVVLIAVTVYVLVVSAMLHASRGDGYTVGELFAALAGPLGMLTMMWRAGRIKKSVEKTFGSTN